MAGVSSEYSRCKVCGNIRTGGKECAACSGTVDPEALAELRRVMTPTQTFGKVDILKLKDDAEASSTNQPGSADLDSSHSTETNSQKVEATSSVQGQDSHKPKKGGIVGFFLGLFGSNK